MSLVNPPTTNQDSWHGAQLLNGWVNYNSVAPGSGFNNAAYYRDSLGVVHLRGLVANGTYGSVILILPTAYKPLARELFCCYSGSPAQLGRIDVLANGEVTMIDGQTGFICLDGIVFRNF